MAGENPPVPDPTVLTTEQLLREISNATDFVDAQLKRVEDVAGEKFDSVDKQFELVERQRVEQKLDTATAVAAALAAAKEAVTEQTAASEKSITKSETATAEQLRQLTATFTTALGGLTNILDDLKERVGKIESRKEGSSEFGKTLVAIAGLALSVVLVIATIAALTHGFTK